jgi:phosphotriesterase-related protein
MTRTIPDTRVSRRRVLRLLTAGCAAGLTSSRSTAALQRDAAAARAAEPRVIIRTILGDIDPSALHGRTLMHEHIGTGRRPAGTSRPMDDPQWMADELIATKKYDVECVVAAQTGLPGPEAVGYLRTLSEKTGLKLIATGSYYMASAYPRDTSSKSEDQIADELVRSAREGRFGAFGEFGVNASESDLAPVEKTVFRALGRAHVRTGVPIFTHNNYSTGPDVPMDMALRQLDLLESVGVDPRGVTLGHLCCLSDPKAEIAQRVARRGAFVAFDRLTRQQQWISDDQRVRMILAFLDAGYADHLLFSSDYSGSVVTSVGEREFRSGPFNAHDGGPGWARSVAWFLPLLRQARVSESVLDHITRDNPRRFLTFVPKES